MTHDDEFIGRLESYLDDYEGLTPLPDTVRDAVRASLPSTKQGGPLRGPRGLRLMTTQLPTTARYGLVAAAAVVALALGATFLGRGNTGGPPPATPTPSATAAPTAGGPTALFDAPPTGDLPAGDYYLDIDAHPARIDFTVPEGWWHYWPGPSRAATDVHAILVNNGFGDGGSAWGLAFTVVDKVAVDPCDPPAQSVDAPATASALADAFSSWTEPSANRVEDVTIGGFSGKLVEFTGAAEQASVCNRNLFTTPSGYEFDMSLGTVNRVNQFYLLDANDTVLVIWTTDYPETNEFEEELGITHDPKAHVADQVALRAILDSVVITPH